MAIKDILVFLDDGVSNVERVQAAFCLAKTHNAKLTGATLASMKPMHAKVSDDKAIARMGEKLSNKLVEDFQRDAQLQGLSVNTLIIFGDAHTSAQKMSHYARNYDLVILRQPNPARDHYDRLNMFSQKVMLLSGRPILFMPYIGARKLPFEKALIAWDGTPAATRAVHDAIPLLSSLKEVVILVVESIKQIHSKKDVLVEGLAAHLANHDVKARITRVRPGINDVSGVILNQISENAIDLLVIGGYGTPTFKQKIFGGVSRSMLNSMIVPVLMSH